MNEVELMRSLKYLQKAVEKIEASLGLMKAAIKEHAREIEKIKKAK